MQPRRRRRLWRWAGVLCLVLGALNGIALPLGWISHEVMDLITNAISWIALALTAFAGEEAAKPSE